MLSIKSVHASWVILETSLSMQSLALVLTDD